MSKIGQWTRKMFPLVESLRSARSLKPDLLAGLTTAVMLVPQGMAYAMLAGLPPIVGLYASVVPVAVYALLGSSRQLAVGPVAMVSLLVATGVSELAPPGSPAFVSYATTLALMVGALQLAMGVLRVGFLVNFLSHPILSGFTSAAALIIGFSQLGHLLGIRIPSSHHVHSIVIEAVERASAIEPWTLGIAALSVSILLGLKKFRPTFPAALVTVVIGSLLAWGLDLEGTVALVGEVPRGLPAPALPALTGDALGELWPTAVTISLVGFMESVAVAKAMASKYGYEVDPNKELVALGAANLGGSLFRAYPVTGGFSRTAVNAEAGAKTGLAGLVTAAVVAVTLLFLTPLFYFLPKAVLAAIIVTAVSGLVDVAEVKHLWAVKRSDLVLLALTFVATLTIGIEEGILIGVGASLLWFVVRSTKPHFAVLGRLPGTEAYRNIQRHPHAITTPGVLAIRFDAQFYFGNMTFLKSTLKQAEEEMAEPLRVVVIDASSINQLDSSADAALHEILEEYRGREVDLYLASVKGPVLDVMQRSGFLDALGENHLFLTVQEAMSHAGGKLDSTISATGREPGEEGAAAACPPAA